VEHKKDKRDTHKKEAEKEIEGKKERKWSG
jgi:hypothetical protein